MTATRHSFERAQPIRFSHCDPAGIVFFPQYLVMTNALVEDWFDNALGVPYAELLGPRRVGLPIVRLEVDFLAPSKMGETVQLGLSVEHLGSRSIKLAFGCRVGDEARFTARQILVCTSLDTHRSSEMPPDMRAALETFAAQHKAPPGPQETTA